MFEEYRKYVLLNSDYPLSNLYNDRNLLKVMADDERLRPRVSACGEDNRTAIVDDIVVNVDGIGSMFRGILKDIEGEEREITRGLSETDARFRIKLPKNFVDEPNRYDVDFWFANMPGNGFDGLDDVMLDVLITHTSFRDDCFIRTGASEVRINAAGCHGFLDRCANLRRLLFSATHISYGSPGRGTEIAATTFRNMPVGDVRNVQVITNRLCFVGGYNKTSHQVSDSPLCRILRLTMRSDPPKETDLPFSSPDSRSVSFTRVADIPSGASVHRPCSWLGNSGEIATL